MSHAFVTIIASVQPQDVTEVRAMIEALGNPAIGPVASALDGLGVIHFASLNVFAASAGDRGHLVFEFSGDGDPADLLSKFDHYLSADLSAIFAHASDRGSRPLQEFWLAHIVEVGQSPFSNPGVNFTGSPGFSVERIRCERVLAQHIAGLLGETTAAAPALVIVADIRRQIRSDTKWSWALEPESIAQGGSGGDIPETFAGLLPIVALLACPFAKTFLWPLAVPAVLVFVVTWWLKGLSLRGILLALGWAGLSAFATAVVAAVVFYFLYRKFRARENAEVPVDRPSERGAVAAIMKRENHTAQNHLAALSVMKPGLLRAFTIRFAFWLIAQLGARYYRPGFLGSLGTIHFARWVTVPNTRDLIFLSNYGGSWESYLEDFITKAHTGLTGVWSNTVDFPKTSNLFRDGATDGERFKRWARRQQIPTGFWYSAYPDITTANIRTNAIIRQGLGGVMTEDEAEKWLSQFGSVARPASTLESSEIQSLVLGGLGFLHEGTALVFELSPRIAYSKAFLAELLPDIAFADGRYHPSATILSLAASALAKFDLPDESIATFPPAFLDGMSSHWRARALGDVGNNKPANWWWGDQERESFDGMLLLYAKTPAELVGLQAKIAALLRKHEHTLVRTIPFRSLTDNRATAEERFKSKCEPFGFLDGISQPVIRGTYKALRGADPIHLVEAGEFILGYPDNRGHTPPSPTLAALHDPTNLLPVVAESSADFSPNVVNADRDLGRNGSYLAVRQLEQEVHAFWDYCVKASKHISLPPGMRMSPEEYVAAKMVGRWRDGSPLVRYPRWPAEHAPLPPRPLVRSGASQSADDVPSIPASASAIRAERQPKGAVVTGQVAQPPQGATTTNAHGARKKPDPLFEPDNDFLFGVEDPQGLRCPFGAHIRRANPRESFDPGSHEQLAITNRHRIMRIGRFYQPQEGQKQGLFFMCLNGDLERQFEFVQQTWVQGSSFQGLSDERDPLMGDRRGHDGFSMPTHSGPMKLANLPDFVHTRGGGYFFLPGRRTLFYLAS